MKPDEPIAQKNIITRGMPKTGQVVEYRAGDDGTYETGWWVRRLNANNRTRFVGKTISGDIVMVDRATGLMWPKSGLSVACNNGAQINWNGAIDLALALDFGGFDDWYLPNLLELHSITNSGVFNPAIHPIFTDTQSVNLYTYWTSTTVASNTIAARAIRFSGGYAGFEVKTDLSYLRPVRH